MFAQIIRGKTSDPMAVRACLDRWMSDLAPTATGWLDTTSGVTDEGDFFALVWFDSEKAAMASISKPEHDRWWAEMEEALVGGGRTFRRPPISSSKAGGISPRQGSSR
jgi:hypothetical protein